MTLDTLVWSFADCRLVHMTCASALNSVILSVIFKDGFPCAMVLGNEKTSSSAAALSKLWNRVATNLDETRAGGTQTGALLQCLHQLFRGLQGAYNKS